MRLTLGSKPRLWGVLALTVVAAIAIIVDISSHSDVRSGKVTRRLGNGTRRFYVE